MDAAWFEDLYARAARGDATISWLDHVPHPALAGWVAQCDTAPGRAVVVGCGHGDDAELLAGAGWDVTAFEISPTAIEGCRTRFPDSRVRYVQADLLAQDADPLGAFDLVVEIYTVQVLPLAERARALRGVARLCAPGGEVVLIARGREVGSPVDPASFPWPLSVDELAAVDACGLRRIETRTYLDDEQPPKQRIFARWRR